ncbi:hypothetical protein NL676_013136 [Syzygium grande]|nr:hypothetical protein NL676_013136 [Syzygium grande]
MVKVVNLVENPSHPLTMDSSDPPFQETYKTLFKKLPNKAPTAPVTAVEERDLPVIDLGRLSLGEEERRGCKSEIARASREWGSSRC